MFRAKWKNIQLSCIRGQVVTFSRTLHRSRVKSEVYARKDDVWVSRSNWICSFFPPDNLTMFTWCHSSSYHRHCVCDSTDSQRSQRNTQKSLFKILMILVLQLGQTVSSWQTGVMHIRASSVNWCCMSNHCERVCVRLYVFPLFSCT